MAEYGKENYSQGTFGTQVGEGQFDAGLRTYMMRVYNWMALGLGVTALVTLFMVNNKELMLMVATGPMKWVLFIAVLALGWFSPRLILMGSRTLAHAAYWTYAALWGALISPMIYVFLSTGKDGLILQALSITAATFAAVSLYGYTTKKDLSGWGTFLAMASIGLVLAIIANAIFFQSEMMSLVVSSLVVLVFAAITAWETQEIKALYYEADVEGSKSIFGAFMLYGSFITLFIHILNILGILDD